MPENEFELYLSLLSRFLRLNPAQQGEIADELRDHLEQRLEELSARGLSREQAIHIALEEFGDAAELAQHFTRAAHSRRRKLIMRYTTYGTAAVLAAGILITAAFWPDTSPGPLPMPNRAVAQLPGGPGGGGGMAAAEVPAAAMRDEEEARNADLEAQLRKPLECNFIEMTIDDAIQYIQDIAQIPLMVDRRAIQAAEESGNRQPALERSISLRLSNVQARTILEIVLEWGNLGYSIRDGILVITTAERAHEIRVYNVRDLLPSGTGDEGQGGPMGSSPGMMGGGPGMGPGGMAQMMGSMMGQARGGRRSSPNTAGMGMGGPAGAGMAPPVAGMSVVHQTASLAQVIAQTVAPESWTDLEGSGSIIEYNGLLIVKNSHAVHGKVRRLLDTMRVALHQSGGMPPGGMSGGAMGGMMGGWGNLPAGGASGGGGNPGQ